MSKRVWQTLLYLSEWQLLVYLAQCQILCTQPIASFTVSEFMCLLLLSTLLRKNRTPLHPTVYKIRGARVPLCRPPLASVSSGQGVHVGFCGPRGPMCLLDVYVIIVTQRIYLLFNWNLQHDQTTYRDLRSFYLTYILCLINNEDNSASFEKKFHLNWKNRWYTSM